MSAVTPVSSQPVVKLRPSDAHRWLVCRVAPGYCARLQAEGRLPRQEFAYTTEGVQAHELAAQDLRGQKLPPGADREMAQHVRAYADFVRSIARKHPGATLLVEQKVAVYYSDRTGYIDAAVLVFEQDVLVAVYVVDLKYGRGVSVTAERNPQLSIYLKSLLVELGMLYTISPDLRVQITIWQPRVQGEKVERTWATSRHHIEALCDWIDEVARDILAHPYAQPFAPSDEACQFCPAAALCDARARDLLGAADAVTQLEPTPGTPLAPPDPSTLTPEQLARVLTVADPLRAWLKKVEAHALAVVQQGLGTIPGHKLVHNRAGHRKWTDKAAAEKLLRRMFPASVVAPPELVSPAVAEGLMKERNARQKMWDQFEQLLTRVEGSIALAPLSDERPTVDLQLEAAEHFEAPGEDLL